MASKQNVRLAEYRRRRDFAATPEPAAPRRTVGTAPRPRFVVRLHHASHRHFDFRLQVGETLRSWAVPKGPSLDPAAKRLAVEVEDHPLEYGDFEGELPKGHYGAGTVAIWDRGDWEAEGDAARALKGGHLDFTLHGRRLRGRWTLVRTRLSGGRKPQWLLIKSKDQYVRADDVADDAPLSRRPRARLSAARVASDAGTSARSDNPGRLTHPDRVMFAKPRVTKRQLADFYSRIAEHLLPGIARRPISLVRCPDGASGQCFFQRHRLPGFSAAILEAPLPAAERGMEKVLYIENADGLHGLVQMNVIEIHAWNAHIDDIEHPDQIVLDLDPGEGVTFTRIRSAAICLRDRLRKLRLQSFVRTSGGKGLHVVVPLARASWDGARAFSRAVAVTLAREQPREFVAVAGERNRKDRIFIDYLRNARGASSVASYSLRARPGAGVATPLTWEELGRVRSAQQFDIRNLPRRLQRQSADPWRGFADLRQTLPLLRGETLP